MNDPDLGKALLAWDAANPSPPQPDPHAQARGIVDRDRRRVARLAWLTAGLWAFAVTGVAGILVMFYLFVEPKVTQVLKLTGAKAIPHDAQQTTTAALDYVLAWGVAVVAMCVGVLALAAGSTVVLVLASRRATLRQVNANLRVISEQLRAIQLAAGGRGAGERPD